MENVGDEKITCQSSVNVAWNSLRDMDITDLTSKQCGLGWTFRLIKPEDPTSRGQAKEFRGHVTLQLVLEATWFTTFADHLSISCISCDITRPDGTRMHVEKATSSKDAVIIISHIEYIPTSYDSDTVEFSFTVDLSPRYVVNTSVPSLHASSAMALANTIHSGDLIDSKFFLYSKRGKCGGAKYPKALFASSAIIHKLACEDLNLLLSAEGFEGREDVLIDLVHPPADKSEADTTIYGYDSDSDLEDDEEVTLISSALAPDGAQSSAQLPSPRGKEKLETFRGKADDSENLSHKLIELQKSTSSKFIRTGRQVFVRDTAFRTWSSLLHYIYFENVEFAKLKSTYASPVAAKSRFDQPFVCSPKSMYRLADKLGINTLKTLALNNIKAQLNEKNIAQEAFSRFTARYPDVLNVETTLLRKDFCTDAVQERISEAMDDFGAGSTYLGGALKGIMAGLVKDRSLTSDTRAPPPKSEELLPSSYQRDTGAVTSKRPMRR